MLGIENKVVAITGASGGIGAATAVLLAERGAKVVLGGLREEALKGVADEIAAAGGEAVYACTDVTRRGDLVDFVALARERFGRLDVNIKGVLFGIAAALPVFYEQGFGHVVNTASTAAYTTSPNQAVYSGTKVAVAAISEGLRKESGGTVRVSIVSPGFVQTAFVETVKNPEVRAQLIEARDRLAMPPVAIARAIAFAIEQPAEVDVNEIVVRPAAQG